MARQQNIPPGSLSKAQCKKRKRLGLPHTPFLLTASGNCNLDISPQDAETTQPPFSTSRPQEWSFGNRQSLPFRCSPRKNGSASSFLGRLATENAKPTLSSIARPLESNDTFNGVKREESILLTPLIRNTTVAPSLQNTQIRERKLEENGIVELDRDEFALQRFIRVHNEMSDLEAILMKGKKRHVFEQMKRNAATKSLSGAERILADSDATPTPVARPTALREGITSKGLVDERNPEFASKVVDTRTEISKSGPASTGDAPSISIPDKGKPNKPQNEHRSDHGAVHPSRRHVFDHPEGSESHEIIPDALPAKPPPKRKELPGMGLIFNPRPNLPQDDRKHQDTKLPRDLQRREVNMPKGKDNIDATDDADVEGAIDSAHDWLQRENALEQEARAKRWVPDPNWKYLTRDQIDTMRSQGSIPPATFYGHPRRWRAPTGWRQPPVIGKPIFTVAKADEILARVKENRMLRSLQSTTDKETEVAPSKSSQPKDGTKTRHEPTEEKVEPSNLNRNKHSSTNGAGNGITRKTKSASSERKNLMKATGYEVDSQRPMKDGKPAIEPQVKVAGDTAGPSKVKTPSKKRKRDADVSKTATLGSTSTVIPESPDLPSMKEIMARSQMAVTSSPAQRKKKRKSSSTEAVEDGSNNAQEPSTSPNSKKRKKAKETIKEYEVARDEAPTTTKKSKKSGQAQESNEPVGEKSRPETFIERFRRLKREETALALQQATKERSQPTMPAPEAATSKRPDQAPPIVSEPAIEEVWQPRVDDEDPPSPQPSPPKRKKHKFKDRRHGKGSRTVDADDTTPENIADTAPDVSQSPNPASPPTRPTRTTFKQHRRRHQSLPPPNTTTTTPTANPNPTAPPPPPTPYDLHLHSIRTRLSNLEAAIATANANPPIPPNPTNLTPTALLQLGRPPLPRAIPPGSTRLTDAELIQVGKMKSRYERHKAAPYAYSWRGRLYAEFDYLLDWVDEEGVTGWDAKVKARLKHG